MTRLVRLLAALGLVLVPVLAIGVLSVGVVAIGSPAAAAPLIGVVGADVDDFTFDTFDADYYLDTDDAGRSTLTTVETFVAVFPEDQNRGIRRAIPERYQGAPTDIEVVSVTDGEGNPRPYSTELDDEFLLVTSAADGFVSGEQTYVFTYTQRNVTRFFANTDDDEFYWDTNGVGWDQPFGSVTARVHVADHLAPALTGDLACYRGPEGSQAPCDIEASADGAVTTAAVTGLAPRENMTVVVAFQPGTFVPRDDSYLSTPLAVLQLLSVLVAVGTLVWAIILRRTKYADAPGRPTIIAEYAPPKGLDLFTAAAVLGKSSKATAAAFVDLAVTGVVRIVETEKTGLFARGNDYVLVLVDAGKAKSHERDLMIALFGGALVPGTEYLMNGKDTALSTAVRGIVKNADKSVSAKLRTKRTGLEAFLAAALAVVSAVTAAVTGLMLVSDAVGGVLPFLLILPPAVFVFVVFGLVFRTALNADGAELRDHLEGLELYIRLAEADRLAMLQSPTGAEREAVSTTDRRQVLDVYERLLPYSVLFGLEKQWSEELGRYYVDESPDWYAGSSAFNSAIFASSIHSLSSTASTSYSGSSSSSSSGGSGGGGSSGGGGGGGGGGGV